MSHNIAPQDTRPLFVQNPRLSDDSEIEKSRSIPTPSNPFPHDRIGGGAGFVKKVSK